MKKTVVIGILLLILSGPAGWAQSLFVAAGSASKPVLEEAVLAYEQKTGASVSLLLGGSGEILTKIRLTGEGDVYLPGSHDFLEKAKTLGMIASGTERVLAYLVPAICVPKGNPAGIKALEDLASPGLRLAIGHPETVCVGLYAVEILEKAGIASQTRGNIVAYLESCAKVANSVALGTVDAVLGWREFGQWSPEKITIIPLAKERIPRLATLPGAVLAVSRKPDEAARFLAFLASEEGRRIYRKWGYLTDEKDVRELAPSAAVGGLYELPSTWK